MSIINAPYKQITWTAVLIAGMTLIPLKNADSQSYQIQRSVISSGGRDTISKNYGISSTLGQITSSISNGNLYLMYSGFWAIQSLSPYGAISTPRKFILSQNYPNPFNSSTQFLIDLPLNSEMNFTLYDILGHSVKSLYSGGLRAGSHTFSWDGKNNHGNQVASGIYYAIVTTSYFRKSVKLTLLK